MDYPVKQMGTVAQWHEDNYADGGQMEAKAQDRHAPIEGGYQTKPQPERVVAFGSDPFLYDTPLTRAAIAAKAIEGFHNGPGDGGARRLFAAQVAEMVDRPAHYRAGAIESIDMIRQCLGEEGFKGFCLGNAIKYVQRARFKGSEDVDIQKAIWYLRMYRHDDPRKEKP